MVVVCQVCGSRRALSLKWDSDNELLVEIDEDVYILLAIPAEHQKSNRDELLPIAPEFSDFLVGVAAENKAGSWFPAQMAMRERQSQWP